jgi:hypothetical protein
LSATGFCTPRPAGDCKNKHIIPQFVRKRPCPHTCTVSRRVVISRSILTNSPCLSSTLYSYKNFSVSTYMQLDKSQHYSIQVGFYLIVRIQIKQRPQRARIHVCPLPSTWTTAAMRKEPGQVCILRRLVTMKVTHIYL